MSISLPPFSNSPDVGAPQGTAARIRGELDAQEDERNRGVLLYELSVLLQREGDDAQAVRDLLASVNAAPDFIEPLERLVSIIERRKSYKNLGKLLDRLCKISQPPDAEARALWMRASFLEDHAGDRDGARASLEQALQVDPRDPTAALFLELLAVHAGDPALRIRSLQARAEIATDPTWKGLLFTDLAALLAAEQPDVAAAALEKAVACKGAATFAAIEALAVLGTRHGRDDIAARALEATASVIMRAVNDPALGDALGVRATQRSVAHAADAWLRASEAHRRRGDVDTAKKLLEQAREHVPDEPALGRAALRLAEASGDTERTSELARALLERGATAGEAASLWLRVAEAAASAGEAEGALEAIGRSLEADPACIPARALQLDLLTARGDAIAFAGAVGQAMGRMNSPAAIASMELLVADVLAREAQRPVEAREAIDRSIALDPSAGQTAHRLGRALAFILDDGPWTAHATSSLLSMELPSTDAASFASQATRSALLSGKALAPALEHLDKAADETARLAALLRLVASDASTEHILAQLANVEADADRARALRLVAAWLEVRSGQAEQAFEVFSQLAGAEPDDVTALTALATLRHTREEYGEAADALAAAANAVQDETLTRALLLEVALLRWRAGDREGAVTQLSALASGGMNAVRPLLAWALRAAKANDLEARRSAVTAGAAQRDPATVALEHLGIDIAQGQDPSQSLASLAEATSDAASPMAVVNEIARAVASRSVEERQAALLDLAKRGETTAAVTAAAAHAAVLDDVRGTAAAPERILASSRAWAEAAPCAEAAIEWYGAARALGDLDAQAEALRALGATQAGDVGGAIAGAGEITRFLVNGAARLVARDDGAARLADLETSPPGCDPARRAYALHHAAEALDDETRSVVRLLVGFNALAAGDAERAVEALRGYTRDHPKDLGAWDGLREAALLSGAYELVAEACGHLASEVDDPARSAELWEQAATVLGEEVRDVARAEIALERAVAADIGRFSSFDKLFRLVRARQDGPRLLELIARRLEVAEEPEEIAKLYWERARVLRKSGDPAAALEALENVVMLEPDHVGALALTGEIFITEKRFEEAAKQLERLARLQDAPNQQRLMSGIAAADIYENKLGKLEEAVGVLLSLDQADLSTPAVRERLARTAAKAGRWDDGAKAFTRLARERETREGRIEAARLAMAVHRDRLETPWDAKDVVRTLLSEIPDDGEALDLVISCAFDPQTTAQWLEEGGKATAASLIRDPRNVEKAKRLVEIAKLRHDPTLQQVALGIQVAAGGRNQAIDEELAAFDARMAKTPSVALDDTLLMSIRHEDDRGPLPDLFRALAPTLAEALGPGLTALAVGRKERVKAKDSHPLRNEIAAWVGAMGVGEFEMYHGGRDPDGIYGVPAEVPALVVGANVTSPLAPQYRAALARELLALRLGTSIIRYRDPTDIAALVTAACNIAGVRLDSAPYAMLAEFERQLTKELPRKLRKALPELLQPVAASGQDAIAWANAAIATLDRMASLACGDVSWALVSSAADRGNTLASPEGRARASRLLAFALTPRFGQIRARLGLEATS